MQKGTPEAVDNHELYDDPPRNYSLTRRVVTGDEPSGTILATDIDAPFVAPGEGGGSEYAELLERELPREQPEPTLTMASFFCGCGGLDLGFRSAGVGPVYANDNYEKACETYAANLDHAPECCDIREVIAGVDVPEEVDVLTGGFPCVTFSMAGQRAGVVDNVHGRLYIEMCRVIKEVQPRFFFAENVKGMLSANGGEAVKLVLAAFLRLGYWTSYEIVNVVEHGVPQLRERVVFVGVRRDQWRGSFMFPRKTHRKVRDGGATKWLLPAVSLREAIGDLPEPTGDINAYDKVATDKQTTYGVAMRKSGEGDPSPTIAAVAGSGVPWQSQHRRMTARECARAQSFPDWFKFEGSMSDVYKQVGNAVPPLYAKRLAEALIEYDRREVSR